MGVPGADNLAAPAASSLWSTINPAHAVQRASAIVTFSEEVTSVVVNRMVDALRADARGFDMLQEDPVTTVRVQIGPGGTETQPTLHIGTVFKEVHGSNIVQALAVTKEAIRFDTFSYTGWVSFREQLGIFLRLAMPIVEQVVPVTAVALEYLDLFYAKNEGPADVAAILDRKSDMLARHAFQRRMPFHSHSGWFERDRDDVNRLVNVDITVADAEGPVGTRRAISIRCHEAEQVMDQHAPRARELVAPESILASMDTLHVSLKKRLSNILTADARTMISLGS